MGLTSSGVADHYYILSVLYELARGKLLQENRRDSVFLLNHIDQKLTVLPVHQLLDIMTLS